MTKATAGWDSHVHAEPTPCIEPIAPPLGEFPSVDRPQSEDYRKRPSDPLDWIELAVPRFEAFAEMH